MFRDSGIFKSVFHNCSSEKTPYLSHFIPVVATLLGPPLRGYQTIRVATLASASLKGLDLGVGLALPLENIVSIGRKILIKTGGNGFSWGRENEKRECRLSGLFTAS